MSQILSRILYLPLDERPCNVFYPQMIAQLRPEIELLLPPLSLLSRKRQPAPVEALEAWFRQTLAGLCPDLDRDESITAIVSIEMWVYGGLLPSRLHQDSAEALGDRLQHLAQIKADYPQLKILASNLIMRTPAYNSSEEEPDYYADFGEAIFRWGGLSDRQARQLLSPEEQAAEQAELAQLNATLPPEYLADYRSRRAKNLQINQATLGLVKSGVLDFLSIPQDDCAPYGFTAQDQQVINQQIFDLRLQQQVHLYPGADEVGCTLLARAWGSQTRASIYVFYSSVMGDRLIPRYEDRPLGESVKAHLLAAGASIAHSPEAADIMLAVNSPGQAAQEAWEQTHKDITYNSYRNLRAFVAQIRQLLDQGKPVAIADVAFSNGGETELVQLLDDAQCWDQLLAYAGWNTSCNSLGTAIATALLGFDSSAKTASKRALACNKIYRLLEDWAYQSIVRQAIVEQYLPAIGASYYDFRDQTQVDRTAAINQAMADGLREAWSASIRRSFQDYAIDALRVYSPWQRMFEIGLDLSIVPADHSGEC